MTEANPRGKGFTRSLSKTKDVLGTKFLELCEREEEITNLDTEMKDGLNQRSNWLCSEYDALTRRSSILQQMIRKFHEHMGRLKFDSINEDRRLTHELDELEERIKSIHDKQIEIQEKSRPLKQRLHAMTKFERNEQLIEQLAQDIETKKAKIKDVEYRSAEIIQTMIQRKRSLLFRKRKMCIDVSCLAQAALKATATLQAERTQRISALKVIITEKQRLRAEKRHLLSQRKKDNTTWQSLITTKQSLDRKMELVERCSEAIARAFTKIKEKEIAPNDNEDIGLELLAIVQRQISNREGEDSMNSFIDWNDEHVPVDSNELQKKLLETVRENKAIKQQIMGLEADCERLGRKKVAHERKLVSANAALTFDANALIEVRDSMSARESRNFTALHIHHDAMLNKIREKTQEIAARRERLQSRMDQLITLISCYDIEISGWRESLRASLRFR